jgi:hypothetical protein
MFALVCLFNAQKYFITAITIAITMITTSIITIAITPPPSP